MLLDSKVGEGSWVGAGIDVGTRVGVRVAIAVTLGLGIPVAVKVKVGEGRVELQAVIESKQMTKKTSQPLDFTLCLEDMLYHSK